jgi:hypothetical protein
MNVTEAPTTAAKLPLTFACGLYDRQQSAFTRLNLCFFPNCHPIATRRSRHSASGSEAKPLVAKFRKVVLWSATHRNHPTMNDAEEPTAGAVEEPAAITLAEFLEDVPPSQRRKVTRLTNGNWYGSGGAGRYALLSTPELQLHCSNAKCNGLRFFGTMRSSHPKLARKNQTSST